MSSKDFWYTAIVYARSVGMEITGGSLSDEGLFNLFVLSFSFKEYFDKSNPQELRLIFKDSYP